MCVSNVHNFDPQKNMLKEVPLVNTFLCLKKVMNALIQ